jgi:hypothetical protein
MAAVEGTTKKKVIIDTDPGIGWYPSLQLQSSSRLFVDR